MVNARKAFVLALVPPVGTKNLLLCLRIESIANQFRWISGNDGKVWNGFCNDGTRTDYRSDPNRIATGGNYRVSSDPCVVSNCQRAILDTIV